jgi:hypothetical protein
MTTTVGASTSYQLTVPALSETADIQVALKLLSYGTSSDPANNAAIGANSLAGYIKSIIAGPTFTGTVTLVTQSASVTPLRFVSGALKSITQTGAMEYDGTNLYLTNDSSVRKTVAYIGDAGHTLLSSGNITALTTTISLSSSVTYRKLLISVYGGTVGSSGSLNMRINGLSSGYSYSYMRYQTNTSGTAGWYSSTSGSALAISGGQSLQTNTDRVVVEIFEPYVSGTKHVTFGCNGSFGSGNVVTASGMGSPVTQIDLIFATAIPTGATYAVYGIK